MDEVLTEEEKRYARVCEFSIRFYGLHSAAKRLGLASLLTPQRVRLAEVADSQLRLTLEELGAAIIELPAALNDMKLWVAYCGRLIPREGEVTYMDRWTEHLLDPNRPMIPQG
ncbi:hypothetical protein [Xanthomonas campestris]|uniref:hypothetical protein n=1 Tax=Xanthomonas campestris TaxID=339 RepID=UPI002367D92A|nr:hypothetical protein [Xanthomonas campestris]WDJ52531.1 hypothetical protein JH293_04610 [Xanthomonas campestris pv. campestris]